MAYQCYVKIKGKTQGQFKAESKKEGRKTDFIECVSYKMGCTVPVDSHSGRPQGHRKHEPLVITKEIGAASPQILNAMWTNETLDQVVIEMVRRDPGGKKEIVTEKITLTNALVVNVQRYSPTSAHDRVEHGLDHLEDVGFYFQKIEVENPEASTMAADDWLQPGG